jgi:hypothetical protein
MQGIYDGTGYLLVCEEMLAQGLFCAYFHECGGLSYKDKEHSEKKPYLRAPNYVAGPVISIGNPAGVL